MLKFALKSMAVRKAQCILLALSIIISAGVALMAYNVSGQINDGIITTAQYYDMIIGPSGSATQLAMNTMFFTDEPLGTISCNLIDELKSSGLVNAAVPFTMGDSYNSSRIVGTTAEFLDGKPLSKGAMFSETYEAVIGSSVAEKYGLTVGSTMVTSHGLTSAGTEHSAQPLTVTGILKQTGTAYDNAVFTSYKTVWAIHGTEADDDGDATEGRVCAILVKCKSFNDYYKLQSDMSGKAGIMTINPATVLREVLEQVDTSSEIVYLMCGIILVMNILVITVVTLLNLLSSRRDIALMRLIGISMQHVSELYVLQNGIVGLISVALAFLFGHMCLMLMQAYASTMGIVLSVWKIYPAEGIIAAAVFVISVLPTLVCILHMSRHDGAEG